MKKLTIPLLCFSFFMAGYAFNRPTKVQYIELPEEICQASPGDSLSVTQTGNVLTVEFTQFVSDKSNSVIVSK